MLDFESDVPIGEAGARALLTDLISNGPEHLRAACIAVRDFDCALNTLSPGNSPVVAYRDKPTIALLTDCRGGARGPEGFDRASMAAFIRTCGLTVVISAENTVIPYSMAAAVAAFGRQNVLIVDTLVEQEIAWTNFVRDAAPSVRSMLISPIGGGTA